MFNLAFAWVVILAVLVISSVPMHGSERLDASLDAALNPPRAERAAGTLQWTSDLRARDSSIVMVVEGMGGRPVPFVVRVGGGTAHLVGARVGTPDDSSIVAARTPAVVELSGGVRWLRLQTPGAAHVVRLRLPGMTGQPWGHTLTLRREGRRWVWEPSRIPAEPGDL